MIRPVKGFTLVEALISVMIFVLVWLAAIEVALVGKEAGSISQHKTQAIYVIQRAIEELHRKPFASIANQATNVSIDTRGTPDITADDLMGTQTITVTSPSAYYKKVIVQVAWNQLLTGGASTTTERCGTFICNDPQAN